MTCLLILLYFKHYCSVYITGDGADQKCCRWRQKNVSSSCYSPYHEST